jgi:hypothetical protein
MAYENAWNIPEHDIGDLLRAVGTWLASAHLILFNSEHLAAKAEAGAGHAHCLLEFLRKGNWT